MQRKSVLVIGIGLVLIGVVMLGIRKYYDNPDRDLPMVYAQNAMLYNLWHEYKVNNLEPSSHRTLDKSQANITTSEGQSYTMLRAVWMDDKTTFDQSWQFTKNNLQHSTDHLMSWKFGKRSNGVYGVLLDQGGQNSASDADSDIALSLIMAYKRWNYDPYLYEAKQIINGIWENEVVLIKGKPVLTANNLEKNSKTTVVVNPSYFSPYSFKLFAKIDPRHDWQGLVDNSYALLSQSATAKLDKNTSSGLPPNWFLMNRASGAILPGSNNLDSNYGYDAMRIPFRLALDYKWFKDPRDKNLLDSFGFLGRQWDEEGSLATIYSHDGNVIAGYESPAMYGSAMGYFTVSEKGKAADYYKHKLQVLYNPDTINWTRPLSYYDDNWAWFGLALYQNSLPNLAEINP